MNQAAVNGVLGKLRGHVLGRGEQVQGIAYEQHENAEGGSPNLNMWGESRSLPGKPPRPETEELLNRIKNGLTETPEGCTVVVNYLVLETGYNKDGRILEPRPNGRLAVEALKEQVK